MRDVQINKQLYWLPTGYTEIFIHQFQAISELPPYNEDDVEEDMDYWTKVMAILMNCDQSVFDFLIGDEYNQLREQVMFLKEDIKPEAIKDSLEIIIEGKQYYFDFHRFSKQNKAQWIDTLANQRDNKTIENLHQLMAIMIRPVVGKKHRYPPFKRLFSMEHKNIFDDLIIEQYNGQTRKERAEVFQKYLTMDKALLLLFFCLNFNLEYLKNSISFSQSQRKKIQMMTKS